jgi:tetratricopeptide (TPR) repeat protein
MPDARGEDRARNAVDRFARAMQSGSLADLDVAVADLRAAVHEIPPDHPDLAWLQSSLGAALMTRAQLRDDAGDADEAVDASRRALALLPTGHTDRVGYLANLGNALCLRARLRDDPQDADEAVELLQQSSAAIASQDPFAQPLRTGLELALTTWVELGGAGPAVKDAAVARRYAAAASARRAWYLQRHELGDLTAAVNARRSAVDAAPDDDPSRPDYLSDLSETTRMLAEHTSSPDLLDDAIEAARMAVAASSHADSQRAGRMVNLAGALSARSRPGDLSEAIPVARQAVEAAPAENELMRFACYTTLGAALMQRYFQDRREEDLEESVASARRALRAARASGPQPQLTATINLANGLTERFVRNGETADIEEAIAHLRDLARGGALDEASQADVSRPLANALVARFERFGERDDIEEAVHLNRLAVEAIPAGHPAAAESRLGLALSLEARASRTHSQDDLEEARRLRLA